MSVVVEVRPRFVVEVGEAEPLESCGVQVLEERMAWSFYSSYDDRDLAVKAARRVAESKEHVRVVDRDPTVERDDVLAMEFGRSIIAKANGLVVPLDDLLELGTAAATAGVPAPVLREFVACWQRGVVDPPAVRMFVGNGLRFSEGGVRAVALQSDMTAWKPISVEQMRERLGCRSGAVERGAVPVCAEHAEPMLPDGGCVFMSRFVAAFGRVVGGGR